jgi:hypothetical protein
MTNDSQDVLDPPRSKLRVLAAKLDEQMLLLGSGAAGSAGAAQAVATAQAWSDLAKALDLGLEPSLRACPHCQRCIPDEATRCRYCMAGSPSVSREKSA